MTSATENPLYLIADGAICEKHQISLFDFCSEAIKGGCKVIQYRHKSIAEIAYRKNLKQLRTIFSDTGTTLIVNDFEHLAEEFGLPLHVGQGDSVSKSIRVPFGRSTHTLSEFKAAQNESPLLAYIAFGTMFPSIVKPEIASAQRELPQILSIHRHPLVLIGGITLDNVKNLPRGDQIRYAVISDAFRFGASGIKKYCRSWGDASLTDSQKSLQ